MEYTRASVHIPLTYPFINHNIIKPMIGYGRSSKGQLHPVAFETDRRSLAVSAHTCRSVHVGQTHEDAGLRFVYLCIWSTKA